MTPAPQVPTGEWPVSGVERVPSCPVCASEEGDVVLDDLRDRIFFCAPGTWTMTRCHVCRTCYLDPRPTPGTIGRAYERYYTHDVVRHVDTGALGRSARLRRSLANGYRNWRFRADLRPATRLGVLVALILPGQRRTLDRQHRHLPKARGGRVLDVGFGDGRFLDDAEAVGWEGVGTDIDPTVIQAARARGLHVVEGTIDEVDGPFDHITMSHSIEHLHDPCHVLRRAHDLLVSGGTLWVETPNADALGMVRFGPDWRGLEPPRHLVLFTRDSLVAALQSAGFADIRDLTQPDGVVRAMFETSEDIRCRREPGGASAVDGRLHRAIWATRLVERANPRVREYVGVVARKP